MIYSAKTSDDFPYIEYTPKSITLGLNTDIAYERILVEMGTKAGIKEFYKSYITADDTLDGVPVIVRE